MLDKLPGEILLRIVNADSRFQGHIDHDFSTIRSSSCLQLAYSLSQVNSFLRSFVLWTYMNETVRYVDFFGANCASFVTVNTFAAIASAENLKSFSVIYLHLPLHESGKSGDFCIAPLLRHPKLETLMLGGLSGVTDMFMEGSCLPNLRKIDLGYCHATTHNVMAALGSFPALEQIGLCGCTNVDDDAMRKFLSIGPARLSVRTLCLAYLVRRVLFCLRLFYRYTVNGFYTFCFLLLPALLSVSYGLMHS